jgi:type I restriction enzyme, S subunit
MSLLPTEALSNLGNIVTGSTPRTSEERFFGGDIPFVTPADLDQSLPITETPRTLTEGALSEVKLLPAGAILVCCIGATIGKVGMAGRPLATNQQINSIVFDQKKVWPRFGFYACRRLKSTLKAMAPATTLPIVSKSKFEGLKIPVPLLDEQRRIAAILDAADALRAKRCAAIAKLETVGQSIFIEMFGELLAAKARIPLADLVDGFRYGTSNKSEEKGYPALRIPNVIDGGLDLSELKLVPVDDAELERLSLKAGDILFVRTNGNPDYVGRSAVFDPDHLAAAGHDPTNWIYASYLIRARPKHGKLHPIYLREFLSTPEGRKALRARSKTSAGQFNINTVGLGAIPIPLPTLDAQKEFAQKIAALALKNQSYQFSRVCLDRLFASLQHRAFHGEL